MTVSEISENTPVLSRQSIGLKGVINARELGGYINSEGKRIKSGVLLRTGQLFSAAPEDKRILSERYRVGTVIDLRSGFEAEDSPDSCIPGAEYYSLPVLEFSFTPEEGRIMSEVAQEQDQGKRLLLYARAGMTADIDIYERIMSGEPALRAYRRFFGLLLENDGDHAVLFHCTQGKDRTGMAAAMLLTLLDFPEELILADYMLTNEANARIISSDLEAVSRYTRDESILESVRCMNGVKRELFEHAFSFAKARSGSVREYIKNTFGVTENDIDKLKSIYLV